MMALLAKKVKKLASIQLLNLKVLLNGRSFSKFKKQYRLKGELGRGGFGIVYRAVRISDEMPVAVKFIERKHVREWAKLNDERVPMEICMLARCTRITGVIRLLDWYSIPEGFIIIMERPYPCIDLFDFIRSQGRLNEDLARFLFRQVAQTILECAHKKVLHRDLKDENIVIDLVNGETRLIDFGAATLLNKTHYSDFQGTRLYCPPEWFLHSVYLGTEAAVWSLGILLYNMLNGRLPFRNEKDICTSHLLGPLPFYTTLSAEASDLIERCLCFEPFTRCSLEEILAHPWVHQATSDWLKLTAGSSGSGERKTDATTTNAESPTLPKSHSTQHDTSYAESGVGSSSEAVCSSRISSSGSIASKSQFVAVACAECAETRVPATRREANTTQLRLADAADATATNPRRLPQRAAKTNSVIQLTSPTSVAAPHDARSRRRDGGVRLHRKSTFDSGIVSAVFSTFRKAFSKERFHDQAEPPRLC